LKSSLQNLRKVLLDSGGSQIAEAAVVLPLLFMILLGIMSIGRAFNVYSTITRAAQDGAAVAAKFRCGGPSCSNAATSSADVADAVTAALNASRVPTDPLATYILATEPPACPGFVSAGCTTDGSSKLRICRNVQLNSGSPGPKQCGAIVSFQYPYHFQVPFASISLTDIQMTAVAERQMEN
jgi:Flp pilus assembly protein TadG